MAGTRLQLLLTTVRIETSWLFQKEILHQK